MKFLKPNRDNLIKITVALCALSALFYWYEIRPSRIKHDCSWVKFTTGGEPERPAKSEEQLLNENIIKSCKGLVNDSPSRSGVIPRLSNTFDFCESINRKIIEDYKTTKPATPLKENWRQAKEDEYKFSFSGVAGLVVL